MSTGHRDILRARELDFQNRVVLNFLRELGYIENNIVEDPRCGNGRADYLVTHNGEQFYVEAHSPNLTKKGLHDVGTRAKQHRFEELVARRVRRALPEIYKKCHLFLDYGTEANDSVMPTDVQGPVVIREIVEKLLPWKRRISELPEYPSSEFSMFRRWERYPKEFLELYNVSIPYPYGKLVVTDRKGSSSYTIRWSLLKHRVPHDPPVFCLAARGGSDPTSYNAAQAIRKKSEQHRGWIKGHPNLECVPLILFLDGRSCLHIGSAGDFNDLDMIFAYHVEWRSNGPDAVILIGTWGVPSGKILPTEVEEGSGDMIFNPRRRSEKHYPICLNPFLRKQGMVRLWGIGKSLQPVH